MVKDYEKRIAGEIACVNFADLEAAAKAGQPEKFRNMDFMVTGPFVVHTEGAFETEYLYERHKILAVDYLDSFGGETEIAPFLGLRGENNYLGCESAVWTKGVHKWNVLRFEPADGSDCDKALYLTEQRNCVVYAAFYVRCEGKKRAVLCWEDSGSRIFLNGRMIADEPFGRVKGVNNMGHAVPVEFDDGLNLILFKLRPGYICDCVDLSLVHCSIYPVVAESGDLAVSYPAKTAVFKETEDGPKQIFPCFAASYSNLADAEVTIDGRQTVQLGAMRAGECKLIRAEAPAVGHAVGVPVALKTAQSEATEGEFQVLTGLLPALRGESLVMTSFHFDTTYHQEQRVYALGAIYITREILKEMRRDRNFKAIISEIDYLHPYYSLYPEDREFLKQMFVEGNTESDCFYNQPNEMTSSGEGVVRNLVYGQLYHRDVMGRICDVYSPGDVFGHFNQMSQLSAKGGCGGVYWGKHILGFWPSFRHISPDGTWLNHRRGGVGLGDATAWDLSFAEHIGYSMANVPGFPVDGDLSWMAETAPAARYAVPSELRAAADRDEARFAAEGKRSPFEATSRDMSLYHAGVSLTRMDFKQANRMAENLLITAEKLSVIAALNGAEYPERALDKAWRQVLCGQHHDSITGTNNEVSFVDLMIEYREAVELAAEICERASKYIAAHVCKDAGKRAVVLFNPHTWDRAEHTELTLKNDKPMGGLMVTDANGEAVRAEVVAERAVDGGYEADLLLYTTVPACGYVVCYVEEMPQLALNLPKVDGETCIENEFYKIVVDPMVGGGIVSLFDKENNRELINANGDGPANRLVALKETHDRMETQHEFYTTGHKLLSDWEEASVQRTVGAEFATLTVRYELGNVVHVTQEITLKAGDRRIDFKTRLDDYRDEDDLFTVTFPVTIKNAKPIFDDRFAPAVRNASRRALSFRTHQMLMASHCAVYPANQWMDYGPSVTMFLNDETANGALQLGMTQIIRANDRAIMDAADELLVALTKKAIPVTPFPDVKQEFRGSQIPHFNEDLTSETRFVLSVNGVANVYEEALAARYPDAYARLTAAAAAETAVAYFADTDNDWQKPIDVLLVKAPTYEALNAWVEATAKALADGRTFSQKAIVADALAEADDYGVAIINTGNIACSVEKGDMLNMMLFHTAEFYGNVGNTNCDVKLVPEKKSHIFTYSLLPHAGSYREAQLFRRALEKNDPLFAVADVETVADAAMPASYSLVKTNEDVIVTAVKAGGYPMASMKGNFGTIADRGVAIRFFEENGMSGEAKLSLGFAADLAETANLLEEDRKPAALADGTVTIPVTPHTIETLVIRPTEAKVGNAEIGANREVTEPTYVRSWEHDLGTMPMGYLALCAVISRNPKTIDDTHFTVDVSVANNHIDIPASGTARLVLPKGWSADITEIAYDVAPEGCAVTPVTITKPSADAKGIVRLEYDHLGQVFEDIFEVGYHNPGLNVVLEGNTIEVTVINETDEMLRGELGLATPIETWGSMGGKNPFGAAEIKPYQQPVVVEAHSRRTYTYTCTGDTSLSYWAVAKLMVNGRIYFQGVSHRPLQPHVLWAHEFINDIIADGGSIKKANALR